jgi:hypothetical protein
MAKYSALQSYLREQRRDEVPMTFAQIERLIGQKLPPSHRYPSWWSNNPFNSLMTRAWLEAGFQSANVDLKERKLIFRKIKSAERIKFSKRAPGQGYCLGNDMNHPLIGWMKATVRIAPGVDLTEPADPDWGEHAHG